MNKKDIISRLQELYIYDLFGFKTELKPLSMILNIDETFNCMATGIHEGKRRLICVTEYRVIILATPVLGAVESTIIKRKAVVNFEADKKFFTSWLSVTTKDQTYLFRHTQKKIIDLYLWAMEQPIKEYDNK